MMSNFLTTFFICSIVSLSESRGASEDCFEAGVDFLGNDISGGHYVSTSSAAACQRECQSTAACNFWTWDPTYHNACWLKTAKTEVVANSDVTSGPKYCEGDHTTPDPNGDPDSMRVMTYNLYGWNAIEQNPWKAENLYKAIRLINPDILGAQEVSKENEVAENIGSDFALAGAPSAGHVIFYRTSVFTFQDKGSVELNEMDHYGTRTVEYAHFTHKLSGREVDYFNTHLCLCNDDQLLGSAVTIADTIDIHRRPGSRIILTGDFNCDGEESKPVRYLKGELNNTPSPVPLDDTFRSYNGPDADGTTFPGNPDKIDYVMVDAGATVINAWIARNWEDQGKASDHWPVAAVVDLLQ